jgi:hypothetical protein
MHIHLDPISIHASIAMDLITVEKLRKPENQFGLFFLLLSKTNCLTGENNKIKKIEMVWKPVCPLLKKFKNWDGLKTIKLKKMSDKPKKSVG